MKNPNVVALAGLAASALSAAPLWAQPDSFHLMQIERVIGGVDGDTTKQAIQLRMRAGFQNFVSQGRVKVFDAAGLNPIVVIDMTTDLPNNFDPERVLIASANFISATTPACVPDFQMTNLIPASYLAAGRLTFEDDFGGVLWSLAWGGAAYTGSNFGGLTNHPTGNFGPPWAGPCPSADTRALRFLGEATAAGGANSTDYALTKGPAVFTNFARQEFTVTAGPTPCYANCDGSTGTPKLTGNDFTCFINAFAGNQSYANCDGSTGTPTLTGNDFTCFINAFATGCT